MLQKTLSICVLVVIFALVFRAGDLSVAARHFLEDRLTGLRITLQPN